MFSGISLEEFPPKNDSEKTDEEKPTKLTKRDILCIVHLSWTNFSVGLFAGMMGPFFPQEVKSFKAYNGNIICMIYIVIII